MEACNTFEDVLRVLELNKYFPCKITLRHIFEAKLNDKIELKDIKWKILNKIINVHLRARDGILSDILDIFNKQYHDEHDERKTQNDPTQKEQTKTRPRKRKQYALFHPQDVFNAVYLCCSPFLKQLIVSKLFMCRIAVPIIFASTQQTEGFLWPLNFVATDGMDSKGKIIEGFLSDQDIKIVSFIRLDETTFSKSELLNNVLSNDPFFQTFYSRNCPLGSNSKRTLDGTVEASYSVPYGQTKADSFDEVVLFLNLRGDAMQYPLLVDVINSVSNVTVVLLQTMNLKKDANIAKALSSIYQSCSSVIIALESNLIDKEEDILYYKLQDIAISAKSRFFCIYVKEDGQNKGMNDIVQETKSDILECISNVNCFPFSRVRQVLDENRISCDYAVKECVEGCQLADEMFELIDARSASIQHFWIKLSKLQKKKYREKSLPQKRNIEKQIHNIRCEQQFVISHLPQMSIAMLQNLYDLKDRPDSLMFFLKSLKLLLDKRSKKILPGLLSRYNDLSNNSKKAGSDRTSFENQIREIKIEIEDASFGVEHLMREVTQIFEAFTYASYKKCPNVSVLKYVENCPSVAANLLIEGYPLEVMDGAASDIPLKWIEKVFTCLKSKIGTSAKLLTLSIMGIQSSGKSTLLNAMFGLQLAVSTGRCTKGVFLQLIPMPKDQFPFQYVLVFDTEGLRSNEHRDSIVTHAHDNQLATFVVGVGDITLINIRGENMSEVSDILEIVVHAFIRMKKVNENFKLQQSCIFVHQDVADTNAKSNLLPGTLQLVNCLDKITNEAAEQEHLPDCHSFDKIIHFDHEKHVFYFPNLWLGTPPLCAINTEYSENVDLLRRSLMSDISARRKTYFSVNEIYSRINNLWEAILSEDFIFSFRNGVALKAERAIESKIFELHRKLEDTASQFLINDAESALRNCEKEENLGIVCLELNRKLTETLSISFEHLQKEWIDFIEDAPLRDIMIQWKEIRLNQFKIFRNEQQLSALKDIKMIGSRIRLEIRQRIILTPEEKEEWKYNANKVVEKCTEHPLDDDIQEVFEKLWSADYTRFSTEVHGETLSINDEIWKIVCKYFPNDSIYLTNELKHFNDQRRAGEFDQIRQLKGCINMKEIAARHLSTKMIDVKKKVALTMADHLFSEIDIFIRNRKNNRFNIVEIREIFDIFFKLYKSFEDDAGVCKFSFSTNFKAMLAVYIWKSLVSIYQRIHDEYEKISGLQTQRTRYKTTLLNNFRKLISEAMKLKTEKIRSRKEEEERRKKKDALEKTKREDEIIKQNIEAEAKLKAFKAKKEQEEKANKKKFEEEIKFRQEQTEKEMKLKMEEEERKRIQNEKEFQIKREQAEKELKLKTEEEERKRIQNEKEFQIKREQAEREMKLKMEEEERKRKQNEKEIQIKREQVEKEMKLKMEEVERKRIQNENELKIRREQSETEMKLKTEEDERKRIQNEKKEQERQKENDLKLQAEMKKWEEQESKLKEEERKREEQEIKLKEEERKREEQELKLKEEERKREEQERKLKEEERKREEQDRKLKEEELKREEQEKKLQEEERKREEQDRKLKEEEQKREEQERKLEEEERKIEEQNRKLKEMESNRQLKMQEEREREQDNKTALSIKKIIDECIISHVSNCLQNKVVTEILQKFEYSKHNIIKDLMVNLAEREDFDEFCSYLHSTTSYVNTFIQKFTDNELFEDEKLYLKLAESQVRLLINKVKNAIKAEGTTCISDMDSWSTHISQNLHFINIPIDSPVRFINVCDFENLTCFIIDYLEMSKDSCISHFKMVSSSSVNWNGCNPYQQIFERLWGCEERCPFCCEPCQKTAKDHDGSHSCVQHRPDGVSGWRWSKTQILSLDTCDANVASFETTFSCNKNRFSCQEDRNHDTHKFRNYKTYNPSWNIPPDNNLSESKYWAWYVCRFEEQIKSRYDVKYPTLSDDWKVITKDDAIQSLR